MNIHQLFFVEIQAAVQDIPQIGRTFTLYALNVMFNKTVLHKLSLSSTYFQAIIHYLQVDNNCSTTIYSSLNVPF